MQLHGLNHIGTERIGGTTTFRGVNPATSLPLEPDYHEATEIEVNSALQLAESAFQAFRHTPSPSVPRS